MVVKGERMAAWTLLVLSACILIPSPRTLRAETWSCSGTRLKLSVQERGRSAVERFRFSLAVSGEGADEATALQPLNRRLDSVRRELKPLVQGQLVVPAPPPTNADEGQNSATWPTQACPGTSAWARTTV